MSIHIHPTAVVDDKAVIGSDVTIGPFCCVGPDVTLGDGCSLQSHVVITGRTTVGARNRFYPFCSIGQIPQDLKYHDEPSETMIGDDNQIRENVTINAGTEGGGMVTRIGSHNLLMAYSHIAHDCLLGDHIVLANCATLAGHVEVDDQVIIGGMTAIQQFVRIGRLAMIGGMSGVTRDVPPYCLLAGGYRSRLSGLNIVGLKRHGFTLERIGRLKDVYRLLLQETGKREQRLAEADAAIPADDADAQYMLEFLRTAKRGYAMHGRDSE